MTWSDTEHGFDDAKKIAATAAMWMAELGGEDLAGVTTTAAAAFDTVVQVSKIAGVAAGMMAASNGYKESAAAALTAAKAALGPVGAANIALAAGAATTTAVVTGAILTYRMRADLSQPAGMEAVRQKIGSVA